MSPGLAGRYGIDPAGAHALALAHRTLLAGGLAVGCAVTDGSTIVAEGRNRAYDPPTHTDPLEGTPLAHAEMNALARVGRVGIELDTAALTLWSTHQPCSMCRAAIDFVGLGVVRVIATDPSAPDDLATEALDHEWVVLAVAMFLVGPLRRFGPEHPIVRSGREHEPEAAELADAVVASTSPLTDGRPFEAAVVAMWDDLRHAADRRRVRTGR